jgi:hypothetical protein
MLSVGDETEFPVNVIDAAPPAVVVTFRVAVLEPRVVGRKPTVAVVEAPALKVFVNGAPTLN